MKRPAFRTSAICTTAVGTVLTALALPGAASAQTTTAAGTNRALELAPDSPYRDPDIVYLEADELVNDETGNVLTASGQVEGRYQDRTIRADKVIYNLDTGEIFAEGNVVITDPTGLSQFADKIELSNELQSGTATNFTLRTADGGLTAAALAVRNEDESIELYNAYYTACEVCAEDPHPTWRLRAKRVSQDLDQKAVYYRDAVFELFGLPVLYTPYFAHPDPSAERASGLLTPLAGISNDKGFFVRTPYFWAVDDYTDLTVTPRIHARVNPVLDLDFKRQFATGTLNWNTSFTYASIFDRDGNAFDDPSVFLDPETAPTGKRLRSHTFADGRFAFDEDWTYGFGVELASDDLYLERYDFDRSPNTRGLFDAGSLRLISQAYAVGQSDDWRFTASAFGFQSLRSTIREVGTDDIEQFSFSGEDDGTLPIAAPRLDGSHFFDVADTRVEAFGNAVSLSREKGEDYARATAGVRWSDTFVAPGGIEVQPFAMARIDQVRIDPGLDELDGVPDGPIATNEVRNFTRPLGQVGVDARYPFIRPGKVDLIVEPRVQATYNAGSGKLDQFAATDANGNDVSLLQDSLAIDLDPTLLWEPNKATGYDFWQEGTRVDVGGSVGARWGENDVSLFAGKSWADVEDGPFPITSGLSGKSSDIVAEASANFGRNLRLRTRLRYDDDIEQLRRVDSTATFRLKNLQGNLRYYRTQGATVLDAVDPNAPREEISGGVRWRVFDNWSTSYRLNFDLDESEPIRQDIGLIYDDDCTRFEIVYTRDRNSRGTVGDRDGIRFRFALATLGEVN